MVLYCADGREWFVGFVFVFLRVPCQFDDFMLRIVPGFNSTLFVPLPAPCHGSAYPSVLPWLAHPEFHYPRGVPKMRPAHFGPEDPHSFRSMPLNASTHYGKETLCIECWQPLLPNLPRSEVSQEGTTLPVNAPVDVFKTCATVGCQKTKLRPSGYCSYWCESQAGLHEGVKTCGTIGCQHGCRSGSRKWSEVAYPTID